MLKGHGGSMIPPPLLPNPRETLGPLPPNPPPPLPPANSGWHPPTSGGNVPPYHHSTPAVGGSLGNIFRDLTMFHKKSKYLVCFNDFL